MGSLADLGKGETEPNTVPLSQLGRYPTRDDVIVARNNDLSYGTSFAPFARFDSAIGQVPIDQVPDLLNNKKGLRPGQRQQPMDTGMADRLYADWMAAQRNPVAALGFDPRRMMTSPVLEGKETPQLNIGGAYQPKEDVSWFDQRSPSSSVHEATHRGLEILRQNEIRNVLSRELEEQGVRAFMLRHFGPIERGEGAAGDKQVDEGQRFLDRGPTWMSRMEDAAQVEIRRRDHKMGPR